MAPASRQEARLRQAVLSLARHTEFGKPMINGARLSVPSVYDTPLSTRDTDNSRGGPPAGASIMDAPLRSVDGSSAFLSDAFVSTRNRFALLEFANGATTGV